MALLLHDLPAGQGLLYSQADLEATVEPPVDPPTDEGVIYVDIDLEEDSTVIVGPNQTVYLDDGNGNTASADGITVEEADGVTPINEAPTLIGTAPNTLINDGDTGSFDHGALVDDPEDDPLTFSIDPALPAGSTFSSTTGARTWNASGLVPPTLHTVTADDGEFSVDDTFVHGVAPVGATWFSAEVIIAAGLYQRPELSSVTIGMYVYGYETDGSVTFNPATGAYSSADGGTLRFWIQDVGQQIDPTPIDVVIDAEVTPDNPATGDIVVNGTAQEGETLTVDVSGIADADGIQGFVYSFTISGSEVSNTNSYLIQSADVGEVIDIAVTMTDSLGNQYSFTSQTDVVTAIPDVTPPVLSSPTGAALGAYSATGSVTTDEDNGIIYYLATGNASEPSSVIKASSRNRVSTEAGTYLVTYTGLAPESTYYLHYIHVDDAGNESNVVSSASFTTGEASAVPPQNRSSINKIADYLRSTGAYGQVQTNQIVMEWLIGEGIPRTELNEMLYKYLGNLGYTGTIDDRLKQWVKV